MLNISKLVTIDMAYNIYQIIVYELKMINEEIE